ncbi:putative UBA-like superfamily protein [Helianthus anomalus]
MDVEGVNKNLVDQLKEMGFPLPRAMRALYYSGFSTFLLSNCCCCCCCCEW